MFITDDWEDAGINPPDENDVETWKKRAEIWRLNAHAAKMQLIQMHQPSSGMVSVPKAKGRNRQNFHAASSAADVSNKIQLNNYTKSTIWPHYKLLLFTGQWKRYDSSNPHTLARALMDQVTMPRSTSLSDYYEDFVLPTFGAKMSSLKGNFIQAMYKAFKGMLPVRGAANAIGFVPYSGLLPPHGAIAAGVFATIIPIKPCMANFSTWLASVPQWFDWDTAIATHPVVAAI